MYATASVIVNEDGETLVRCASEGCEIYVDSLDADATCSRCRSNARADATAQALWGRDQNGEGYGWDRTDGHLGNCNGNGFVNGDCACP